MSFFVLRKISMVENLLFFLGMIRGETDKPPSMKFKKKEGTALCDSFKCFIAQP